MKYQEAIETEMKKLAQDEKVIFLGYNVLHGSKAYGTLKEIPHEKCIETPVAENLMVGLCIGLSLEGFKPVLFFERHDFITVAMDALINHLDKVKSMSRGEFKSPVIIRAPVGATKPLYPGPQHMQDFSWIFKKIFNFPVYEVKNVKEIKEAYEKASKFENPVMIIERKDLYPEEFPD